MAYNNVAFVELALAKLAKMAEITDQHEPSTLLGVRIRRDPDTGAARLAQAEYIANVLDGFNISGSSFTLYAQRTLMTKCSCALVATRVNSS